MQFDWCARGPGRWTARSLASSRNLPSPQLLRAALFPASHCLPLPLAQAAATAASTTASLMGAWRDAAALARGAAGGGAAAAPAAPTAAGAGAAPAAGQESSDGQPAVETDAGSGQAGASAQVRAFRSYLGRARGKAELFCMQPPHHASRRLHSQPYRQHAGLLRLPTSCAAPGTCSSGTTGAAAACATGAAATRRRRCRRCRRLRGGSTCGGGRHHGAAAGGCGSLGHARQSNGLLY